MNMITHISFMDEIIDIVINHGLKNYDLSLAKIK